jgi:hypothetical protein
LADVGADDAAQREVEQVRGGVVALDGAAVNHVHAGLDGLADERLEEGGGDGLGAARGGGQNVAGKVGNLVEVATGFVLDGVADLDGFALEGEHAAIAAD